MYDRPSWRRISSYIDLPDLRALLGFERWQSANKGLSLGSVKEYQGSIGVVEASRIKVVLDGISPSSFGATSLSFPAKDVWVEGHRPFIQGGRMAHTLTPQKSRRRRRSVYKHNTFISGVRV